jgi:hypothetical protein
VKETCVLVIIVGLPNARSTCCTVANTRIPSSATSGRGRACAVSTAANAATPTVAKPIRQIVFIVASSNSVYFLSTHAAPLLQRRRASLPL